MAQLSTRRQLAVKASPGLVWDILTDINAWSEWQSAISSARASVPLAEGSRFKWKSGGLTIASTVQSVELNHRITWTGKSIGTDARHTWTVEAQNGGALVSTEEQTSGWLVGMLKLFMPSFLDKSLDVWMRDLKVKAEAAAGGGPTQGEAGG